MSKEEFQRQKTYKFSWDKCPVHDWRYPVDSQFDREVVCYNCGMPGDKNLNTGEVFYPAT